VRLLENTQLRREAETMVNAKLLSSEEKLTERLQNYSTQKGNDTIAQAKLLCSVEKLTELQTSKLNNC